MPNFHSTLHPQVSDTLLMIRPVHFGFNDEAYQTNSFQKKPSAHDTEVIQTKALAEFDQCVARLRKVGLNVIVHEDDPLDSSPDSIFPNNWISTHSNGYLVTYPMAVSNRRRERKKAIVDALIDQFGYKWIDLSAWENEVEPRYLEGTGSMIFDREHRICYAALSPRTSLLALTEFTKRFGYELVTFNAYGKTGEAIYHTNVMLSIGETFAVVGLDTVALADRDRLIQKLESSGKEVIAFSNEQIYEYFAGNMLQVKSDEGERILVLSNQAFQVLTTGQLEQLNYHNELLLPIDIRTIERVGGGSVRCMMAEVFRVGDERLKD